MIRWTACLLPLWLFVAVAWAADDADPDESESVGRRGDPTQYSYRGARLFTAAQFAKALKYDPNFLSTAHESSPLSKLLEMTALRIREGYRSSGYADAKVEATLSANGNVEVQIDEGPRYICGGIQIKAPDGFPVDALRQWICAEQPPEHGYSREIETPAGARTQWFNANGEPTFLVAPVWQPGTAASFALVEWVSQEHMLQSALRALGYRKAEPHVRVERKIDGKQHLATLVVDLSDLGPRTTIGKIEINGLDRNPLPEVLRCLQVKEGMVFSTRLEDQLNRKLRACARFRDFNVDTSSINQDGVETLLIDVKEYEKVPPLGQQLTPKQEVIVRLADWLSSLPTRDCDLVASFEYKQHQVQAVISPQRGMWARIKIATDVEAPEFWYEFCADQKQHIHCLPGSKVKVVAPTLEQRLGIRLQLQSNPAPEEGAAPYQFAVGPEIKWGARWEHFPSPLFCIFSADPVAAIAFLDEESLELKDGHLGIIAEGLRVKIDAANGRLIEFLAEDENLRYRIATEVGTFDKRRDEFLQQVADFNDSSDPRRPIETALRFLTKASERIENLDPRVSFVRRIIARMTSVHAFDSIDQFRDEVANGFDFYIPSTVGMRRQQSVEQRLERTKGWVLVWMMANDKLVPRGHWTRRYLRDVYLGSSGFQKSARADLPKLSDSSEVGPVHRLMTSTLADTLGMTWGAVFARGAFIKTDGSDRLTIREFRHDIRLFCDERYLPGQFVRAVAAELRESSDNDHQKLLDSIPKFPERKKLLHGIKLLRESRRDPLDEALPRVLEKWWDEGLHDLIEAQLKALYKTLKPPAKRESA